MAFLNNVKVQAPSSQAKASSPGSTTAGPNKFTQLHHSWPKPFPPSLAMTNSPRSTRSSSSTTSGANHLIHFINSPAPSSFPETASSASSSDSCNF
ncbi:hypothetical protein PGT21_012524 [Puccinia graminis f. sp. tritici]|uniref:Uncharacterized protein n=1 Tax=Puccinia graminis f. sp. tritici TaxID=56615 RepID=A0A5B0PPW6_PUCGR|nr:hypothetical protein PGT21_012524 [Puccinia graminis f. sp. tritici]